ncbi:hypothetical protein LTR10_009951 [Elasticomyces elasticus]|nr:hypothetical protein LTR10_009951 [Elasticomyces elasticus]KAK4970243.1 hypothetical protein LTR42_008410 [Elasticomyces elasticus]
MADTLHLRSPDVDLDQVITTLTAAGDDILNDPVSSAKATQQISKIFNTGFFMLPLTDILTSDFNSSLTTGLNAGFQLIRQQTVMAVLAAQSYFDDCNGITGSRFINNQCFTLEQRTPNGITCDTDSSVIDSTIVLKLDSSSEPYGFDLPSFYQNVQACNNGKEGTGADFADSNPPCAFGIPFVTGSNTVCNAASAGLPAILQLPCSQKVVCPNPTLGGGCASKCGVGAS